MYNNTEATIDKIWKTVENVWNETSSSEVARAFVLAYRVMDVIIKEDGNNDFLSNKWNPTLQCSQGLQRYHDWDQANISQFHVLNS